MASFRLMSDREKMIITTDLHIVLLILNGVLLDIAHGAHVMGIVKIERSQKE